MGKSPTMLRGALLAAALFAAVLGARALAFASGGPPGRAPLALRGSTSPAAAAPVPARQGTPAAAAAQGASLLSLCGQAVAVAVAAAACARGARVAMRSQGQGGRFNYGQHYMPSLKGAKKKAVLRPRKNYGTHSAMKVPRRYPLYDIMEEMDETTPIWTIISEPEEPLMPVEDAPLLERYPWAGNIDKVLETKQEVEDDTRTALEPLFASWTGRGMPPIGRRQLYIARRGWPKTQQPPWLNRPLIGEGVIIPKSMPFRKDRRPKWFQLTNKQKKAKIEKDKLIKAEREAAQAALADPDDEDDLDTELDAMVDES